MRTFMMLLRKNGGWIIFLDRFSILVSIRGPILAWNQIALNTKVETEINWILILMGLTMTLRKSQGGDPSQ